MVLDAVEAAIGAAGPNPLHHGVDHDVTDATADEIRSITVIGTIVGGEVAYCAGRAVCGGG
jgi:hypothetical protein